MRRRMTKKRRTKKWPKEERRSRRIDSRNKKISDICKVFIRHDNSNDYITFMIPIFLSIII